MKRAGRGSVLAAALVLAAGCTDPLSQQWSHSLAGAQNRWNSSGIKSYQFTFQVNCFCAITQPVTVTVLDTVPVMAVFAAGGAAVDTSLFRDYLTVDRMFATLRRAVDHGPATFDATFSDVGYPLAVSVDPSGNTLDDEYGISITVLTATP